MCRYLLTPVYHSNSSAYPECSHQRKGAGACGAAPLIAELAEVARAEVGNLVMFPVTSDVFHRIAFRITLYLAVENIDHTRTRAKSPQTNGIVERFHRTVLNEFYRVAFRRKIYRDLEELQTDLDQWLKEYNEARSHQGRWCYGKTPMQTFVDSISLAKEKILSPAVAAGAEL